MLVNTLNNSYLPGLRVYYLPEDGDISSFKSFKQKFVPAIEREFGPSTIC